MDMEPARYLRYVVLEQVERYRDQGIARALSAFGRIADEAEEYANAMFDSYMSSVGGEDPSDWVEEARDQGVEYYSMLNELRQATVNLLAVGLRHLFEQHQRTLTRHLMARGKQLPKPEGMPTWPKVEELRLVANTVKHADGDSARKLKQVRPDLFVTPVLRDSPMARHIAVRQTENPMGGTDLFVSEQDLQQYCDAVREVWVETGRLL